MFELVRDSRGSLVHVRTRDGECIGCIEAGLYEIVRALVLEERAAATPKGRCDAAAAVDPSVRRDDGRECYEAIAATNSRSRIAGDE